eukprot:scaffold26645_cov150-Skeletonema_menzelii.AAC.21
MASGEVVNNYDQDGNSLIVGFPQAPRQRGASISNDSAYSVRSVSFSPTSELALIPSKSEQELASSWYSKEDKNNQKRMIQRNAAEVSRILESGQVLTDEDLCETVGMDNFMSPSHIQMSKIGKQRHAQSIIFAQDKCDPALLSRLSKRSSLKSRQRAHDRALSQFRLR